MKEKIKARLKAKFSGVNLSQKRQDAIADKLAKKLTDESAETEIDEALDDLNEIYAFSDMAKSDDRTRTEDAKKKADEAAAKAKEDKTPEPGADAPAWAKTLIETNNKLTERLNSLESGKTTESRRSQLEAKLKDAPEKLKTTYLKQFDRMNFKDDEDFTGFLTEVETGVNELVQDFSNSGLKGFGAPKTAGGKTPGKEASKEEIKSVVDGIMPK